MHRAKRQPEQHGLILVFAEETNDSGIADVGDHATRDDQTSPDQAEGGRRLHDCRGTVLQPRVQRQRQDNEHHAKHHIDEEVSYVRGDLIFREECNPLSVSFVAGRVEYGQEQRKARHI